MQETHIEWTSSDDGSPGFTSNPIRYRDAAGKVVWACVHTSDGCIHCYAETLAHRYGKGGPFTAPVTAKVTPYLDEREINLLLRSPKIAGKRVFLGDMTDVFGEWVPDELLDRLFAVMSVRPDVTWQILTKRANRMQRYITKPGGELNCRLEAVSAGWLGVSVEDQRQVDERIPLLLQTPAAVRFLSVEPLLEAVDLSAYLCDVVDSSGLRGGVQGNIKDRPWRPLGSRDLVIVGGESGPGARPCELDWVRSVVEQCRQASIPVFVKQLGSVWARGLSAYVEVVSAMGGADKAMQRDYGKRVDPKGGDMLGWPDDLRVREFPQ